MMKKEDFYFKLPEELIAQDPLEDRSASRLLVLDKESGKIEHRMFRDIKAYLKPGDCLVINDTKVIPARLIGSKIGTDAKIEILLLKRKENDIWETLVKPGKKAKPGTKISFGEGLLIGEFIVVVEEGNRLIQFSYQGIFEEILDQLGQMPLPPYITHQLEDKNRYQTVYAKHSGSAAAPTAGLHFTPELLKEIKESGVDIAHVTLHVGLGTFRPVKVENIQEHIQNFIISRHPRRKRSTGPNGKDTVSSVWVRRAVGPLSLRQSQMGRYRSVADGQRSSSIRDISSKYWTAF